MKFYLKQGMLLLVSMVAIQAFSQKYVSVTPLMGFQRCFSNKLNGNSAPDFKNNTNNHAVQYGIFLDYHVNRFVFSAGWAYNNVGYSYRIGPKYSSLIPTSSSASTMRTVSFPIRVAYELTDVGLFYKKTSSADELNDAPAQHFINFKLKVFGGLVLDNVNWPSYIDTISSVTITQRTYTQLNKVGLSGTVGIAMQFMHHGKERLALSFYYHQGFTSYQKLTIDYTESNQAYQTSLVAKGTTYGITLSYPIKIWDIDKRKAMKAVRK